MQKFELTESEFTDLIDWMDANCYNPPLDSDAESLSDSTSTTDSGAVTAAILADKKSKDSEELRHAMLHVQGVGTRSAHHHPAIRHHAD